MLFGYNISRYSSDFKAATSTCSCFSQTILHAQIIMRETESKRVNERVSESELVREIESEV